MKYILVLCFALLGITNAFSQNNATDKDNKSDQIVQTLPKFPGDINKWLSDNINYPDEAIKNNIEGTVYVTFIVEKDGSVSTVNVSKSVSPSLDKEAIRVVSAMPKWTPGMQDGKAVRISFEVPIQFLLENKKSSKHKKN